jgi:hypothetical protein
VKALKGVRKPVYEARVNLSLRLLFTVARAPARRPPHELEHFLLAWDVVDHDHLNRAKRLNLQPETGFLDFAELASHELADPPLAPEAEWPAEPLAAHAMDPWLNDPAHQACQDDALAESIRWFELDPDVVTDEAEWQALLDDPTVKDLELKLSREQAETLFAPGPVLLRGTAGSGKTTVCLYRLARAALEQPRQRHLLVTYSESLLAAARQLFHDLCAARRRPPPEPVPDFFTFPQLYRQLCGDTHAEAKLLRYPAFARWYTTIYGRSDAALAWEEIRGIIKGAALDLDCDHLSYTEYENLGRKRAPLFAGERPRLYQVFTKYQAWCRMQRRVDDIDLARAALRALRQHPERRYHQVVCDEGQDLTELELRFLLELSEHPSGLLFAADPQQIVNPSGFRWAELRSLLRERLPQREAPEIRSLTRNYRSVHSIVALANALIQLQRDRTGRSDDDDLQQTTLQGAAPVLVSGPEEAVLAQLRGFGPRCAVIAGTAEEAQRLAGQLASERVFDILSAKGLEFDGCVLWNVLQQDAELWRTVLLGREPMKEDPVARRAIHHAYVAVTRARRYLGVYEQTAEAAALWDSPALRALVERDAVEALGKFMVFAASPGEWAAEGDYFLARGRYRQAAECYRRAGDQPREELANAAHHESVEEFAAAAAIYLRHGALDRAAPCLERQGQYAEAGQLYHELRQWRAAGRCLERAGKLKRAAEAFQAANDTADYHRCLRQHHEAHRQWIEAARIAVKQGDQTAAAALYEKGGQKQQAMAIRLEMAHGVADHGTAATLCEQAGDLAQAAEHYTAAGRPREAARCRALAAERRQDHAAAARAWHEAGQPDRALSHAAKAAEAAGDWLRAAECYDTLHLPKQVLAALRHSTEPRAKTWLEALELRHKEPLEAAKRFEQLGMYEAAIEAATASANDPSAGHHDDATAEWISDRCTMRKLLAEKKYREAAALGTSDRSDDMSLLRAQAHELAGDPLAAGQCYYDGKDYAKALAQFRLTGNAKHTARAEAQVALAAGRFEEAAKQFLAGGLKRESHKAQALAAEARQDFAAAATWYTQARMAAQARRCRTQAGLAAKPAKPVRAARRGAPPPAPSPASNQPDLPLAPPTQP